MHVLLDAFQPYSGPRQLKYEQMQFPLPLLRQGGERKLVLFSQAASHSVQGHFTAQTVQWAEIADHWLTKAWSQKERHLGAEAEGFVASSLSEDASTPPAVLPLSGRAPTCGRTLVQYSSQDPQRGRPPPTRTLSNSRACPFGGVLCLVMTTRFSCTLPWSVFFGALHIHHLCNFSPPPAISPNRWAPREPRQFTPLHSVYGSNRVAPPPPPPWRRL